MKRLDDVIAAAARGVWIGILVAFTGLVAACSEDGETPVVAEELAEMDADNVVYGMSQIMTHQGVREAVVEADTAYFFQDSSAVHLRGVVMTFYREQGGERARVVAERGRLDTTAEGMVGRGNVVLTIPEADRRIETRELHYSSGDDRIWSDTYTVMQEDDELTCGSAFRSDLEFENVVIEDARTANCRRLP